MLAKQFRPSIRRTVNSNFIVYFCTLLLTVFCFHVYAQCTLSLSMSKGELKEMLGEPEWIQEGGDCWSYFNSGIECIFQNGQLYSVRYITGCPSLPERLSNSGVILGGPKKQYTGLGKLVDSDIGKYITDIYTDNKSFMYALNYSKLTERLENVLVRQMYMLAYCSKKISKPTSITFQKWYVVGGYVIDYLDFLIEANETGLKQISDALQSKLKGTDLEKTGILALFKKPYPQQRQDVNAALLRNELLALAAQEGRTTGSRVPVTAVFDGIFVCSIAKHVAKANEFYGIAAIDEITSHFKGRNRNLYAVFDERLNADIDQVTQLLSSKDYVKKDVMSIALRIDKYMRHLKYE